MEDVPALPAQMVWLQGVPAVTQAEENIPLGLGHPPHHLGAGVGGRGQEAGAKRQEAHIF